MCLSFSVPSPHHHHHQKKNCIIKYGQLELDLLNKTAKP